MPRGNGETLLFAFGFFGWLLFPSLNATECVSDGRYVMGTVLEITLCADHAESLRQHFGPLFTTATHVDTVLTTYNPTSPVSRLNATAGKAPFPAPHEVSDLLALLGEHGTNVRDQGAAIRPHF